MKPRHHGGGFREWLNILYHTRNHFQNGNNPDFRLFRKTPKSTQNPKYRFADIGKMICIDKLCRQKHIKIPICELNLPDFRRFAGSNIAQ